MASARNGAPPQTPPGAGRRAPRRSQFSQGPSLADILDNVAWDAVERGPLLIVSPEETVHSLPFQMPMTAEEGRLAGLLPEAEANGEYRLPRVAEYFNRRVVNLHSLSVYAPATMSVLNSTRLPKPNAYAGMTSADKARLLTSTFTPDQWRQISSAEGIGAGDLTIDQRDLFLSMLPDPFVVDAPHATMVMEGGVSRMEPPPLASLSGDQRESVRISLQRQLNWTLKTGTQGRQSFGPSVVNAAEQPRLEVPQLRFEPTSEVFGVNIVEDVPSRAKPTQLPADWEALDKNIDLGSATTIGDLVRLIAKQTGAELYCDPRYEDRKLYVRGTSAQAGDICRALAWGVTGTWRRLDKAFVLTDDLVGLGVRHALIDSWIRQNVLLAQARNRKTDAALKSSHFADYVGWAPGDPAKPDEALRAKIAENEKAAETDRSASLFVPLGELSPEVQATIRQQMNSYEVNRVELLKRLPNMRGQEPADTSGVYLSVGFQPDYQIPGVGSIRAENLGNLSAQTRTIVQGFSGRARAQVNGGVQAPPVLPALAFPPALANRVLLVAPKDDDDLAKLAAAAHRGGFTQLWVSTDRGDTKRIALAIQAGAASGLRVQAVVSLTRPAPADKPEWQERTILGDTLTGYAKRWRNQLADLRLPEDPGPETSRVNIMNEEPTEAWGKEMVVAQMLRGGDFLRCDDPEAMHQVGDEIGAIAALKGLDGVVFRDVAAPGFTTPLAPGINFGMSSSNPGADPLLTMGYSDATRLACLRKEGFDPSDLSPLGGGERINLPFGMSHSGQAPQISVPFFHDYGAMARNSSFNGQSLIMVGAKDAWERWCAFRQDLDAKFVASIAAPIRASSPAMSLMSRRTMGALDDNMIYYVSLDSPAGATAAATPVTSTPPGAATRPTRDPVSKAVRAASRVSYFSLKYDATLGTEEATRRFEYQLPYSLQSASDWDGVVVDLSEASRARALEVLAAFPDAPQPPAAK